jgi:hypothetical protein
MVAAGYRKQNQKWGLLAFLRSFFLFALLSVAPGAETGHPMGLEDFFKKMRYEPIKLQIQEGEALAEGELDTGKKCVFLVDTGWHMTTLDTGIAAGRKTLRERGVELEDSFLGRLTNSSLVLMDKLVFGRAQFMNQPAAVQKLEMDYIHLLYDGALGCDFLFRNSCLIDCGSWQLYVRGAKPTEAETAVFKESLRRGGYIEVPLSINKAFTVEAQINGHPVKFLVDTGAGFSVLDDSLLGPLGLTTVKRDRIGSRIPEEEHGYFIGIGKVGIHKFAVATVNDLQLGSRQWKSFHFEVTNLKSWGLAKSGCAWEEVKGLLGQDFLHWRSALIDCGNHTLWLKQ